MGDVKNKIFHFARCIEYALGICGMWGVVGLILYTTYRGESGDTVWLVKDMVYTGVFWLLLLAVDLNRKSGGA